MKSFILLFFVISAVYAILIDIKDISSCFNFSLDTIQGSFPACNIFTIIINGTTYRKEFTCSPTPMTFSYDYGGSRLTTGFVDQVLFPDISTIWNVITSPDFNSGVGSFVTPVPSIRVDAIWIANNAGIQVYIECVSTLQAAKFNYDWCTSFCLVIPITADLAPDLCAVITGHPDSTSPSSLPLTELPTTSPTVCPSNLPSISRSSAPSPLVSLQGNPTAAPSSLPTAFLSTRKPIAQPSAKPSVRPKNPTRLPSIHSKSSTMPIAFPSAFPSIIPSSHLSTIPSCSPSASAYPSITSSLMITLSLTPSAAPTYFPSHFPSENSTESPNVFSSPSPTQSPTVCPSNLPSISRSSAPSPLVSLQGNPTAAPSSLSTTFLSTRKPIAQPSAKPSVRPKNPTRLPSIQSKSSTMPIAFPSALPSIIPSSHPSPIPSCSPSADLLVIASPQISTSASDSPFSTSTFPLPMFSNFLFLGDSLFQYWICFPPSGNAVVPATSGPCRNFTNSYFRNYSNLLVNCYEVDNLYCSSQFQKAFPGAINFGRAGFTISQLQTFVQTDPALNALATIGPPATNNVTHIIVSIGTNSLLSADVPTMMSEFKTLVAFILLKFPSVDILLLGVTPSNYLVSNNRRVALNRELRLEFGNRVKYPYLRFADQSPYFVNNATGRFDPLVFSDGIVHLSKFGYDCFERAIKNFTSLFYGLPSYLF